MAEQEEPRLVNRIRFLGEFVERQWTGWFDSYRAHQVKATARRLELIVQQDRGENSDRRPVSLDYHAKKSRERGRMIHWLRTITSK